MLQRDRPRLAIRKISEWPLSGEAVSELMRAVLEKKRPFRFRAKGMSMFPFLKEGDQVTFVSVEPRKIQIGDIVAFIHPESKKFTVHRVIKKAGNQLLIKGDHNPGPDGFIPEADILGSVSKIERAGKRMIFSPGPGKRIIALWNRCQLRFPVCLRLQNALSRPKLPATKKSFVSSTPLPESPILEKTQSKRSLISFNLEITARCNNDCRHCYIALPAGDKEAKRKELSVEEISRIADEAASMGALWCLVGGGEPLLREDFFEIFLALKKKGLLVVIFTNATLITQKHIEFFKKYPPRDIEVTVYGVTKETYERVTRTPGSFEAFRRGLDLLLNNGIKVRLKAMALRSSLDEFPEIARFCRERTKDFFRFDPFLNMRFDGNPTRNGEIESERLSPSEIATLERSDPERFQVLEKKCSKLFPEETVQPASDLIFNCGTGNYVFDVSYDGYFRLCTSLWHPDCLYNLKKGSVREAWNDFVPKVLRMRSARPEFLSTCRICPLADLCFWCPANAHLETGQLDRPVGYFCRVAQARADQLKVLDKAKYQV